MNEKNELFPNCSKCGCLMAGQEMFEGLNLWGKNYTFRSS